MQVAVYTQLLTFKKIGATELMTLFRNAKIAVKKEFYIELEENH